MWILIHPIFELEPGGHITSTVSTFFLSQYLQLAAHSCWVWRTLETLDEILHVNKTSEYLSFYTIHHQTRII